jgi:hypothetical protein
MLDQEQNVADPPGAAIFDERPLQRQSIRVRRLAQSADFNGAHIRL